MINITILKIWWRSRRPWQSFYRIIRKKTTMANVFYYTYYLLNTVDRQSCSRYILSSSPGVSACHVRRYNVLYIEQYTETDSHTQYGMTMKIRAKRYYFRATPCMCVSTYSIYAYEQVVTPHNYGAIDVSRVFGRRRICFSSTARALSPNMYPSRNIEFAFSSCPL